MHTWTRGKWKTNC